MNCGGNSMVECDLPKVEVEGSSPFRRSEGGMIHG